MHGNVSEWTSDVYEGYTSSAVTDPTERVMKTSECFAGGAGMTWQRTSGRHTVMTIPLEGARVITGCAL